MKARHLLIRDVTSHVFLDYTRGTRKTTPSRIAWRMETNSKPVAPPTNRLTVQRVLVSRATAAARLHTTISIHPSLQHHRETETVTRKCAEDTEPVGHIGERLIECTRILKPGPIEIRVLLVDMI